MFHRVGAAWRESAERADDGVYLWLRERLLSRGGGAAPAPMRRRANVLRLASKVLGSIGGIGRPLPQNAVFLHATQFPEMRMFRWLDSRPDIAPVFFVHDLLPLHRPDWFTKRNVDEHRGFLDVFLRYARAAIVNTEVVRNDLQSLIASRGGRSLPILVAPMPAAPIFAAAAPSDPELRAIPYFVMCGTIEPRKNHRLMLKVWEELLRRDGAAAPKLVIAGRRGWNNEDIFRSLDGLSSHSHIIEAPGLSTAALVRVLANARALLMPALAEGYGLPIVEALCVGTPVIAADIPVFREVGGMGVTYCDNQSVAAWLEAIGSHMSYRERAPGLDNRAAWQSYFGLIDRFLAEAGNA
jgi:glycosyltransferase involved in cell wall biosynthesis